MLHGRVSEGLERKIRLVKRLLVRFFLEPFVPHNSYIVGGKSTIIPLLFLMLFCPIILHLFAKVGEPCLRYPEAQIFA